MTKGETGSGFPPCFGSSRRPRLTLRSLDLSYAVRRILQGTLLDGGIGRLRGGHSNVGTGTHRRRTLESNHNLSKMRLQFITNDRFEPQRLDRPGLV